MPAKTLKILIIESGQSQRAIAHATGIPEARMSSLANGWIKPRDHERTAIAAALGQPVARLFGREREPVNP